MTVTESGYYINEKNKLNLNLEIIKNNIAGKENSIIYAYLMAGLKKRMMSTNKKITLFPTNFSHVIQHFFVFFS